MKHILLIMTGGTISLVQDPSSGVLYPADTELFKTYIPELYDNGIDVRLMPLTPFIDSSDMDPEIWARLAHIIYDNYSDYDGFVITHGTDTMAYTASALSFMLENLSKPVVFTGAQLPIGVVRSDARENLTTAIEIAAEQDEEGNAIVPEVTIFFDSKLYRANRCTKKNSEWFAAFKSYNYEPLAVAGVHIKYSPHLIHYSDPEKPLRLRIKTDRRVVILRLFPGISEQTVRSILDIPDLKAVILETYGSGNAPRAEWLHQALKQAVDKGIIIVNKTQCVMGAVEMGRYQTSLNLMKAGVLSGYDITTEALLAKMMYLLGEQEGDTEKVKQLLQTDLCGEVTIDI